MISRATLRCSKLRRDGENGLGYAVTKTSATLPMIAGTWVTLLIQIGRRPRRKNSRMQVRPYSTQESPCVR
ncbi:hypothetical protein D3C81_948810 [compost metagenome]